MTKEIFFDYGDLLFKCECNSQTLNRAHNMARNSLVKLGKDVKVEELDTAFQKILRGYQIEREKEGYPEWPLKKIIKKMFLELSLDVDNQILTDIAEIYRLNDHNSFPMPNIEKLLPSLAKNYRLGIISNCPHDSLIHELNSYNLLNFFDTITISCYVGVRKPNPKIYLTALKKANVSQANSLFVSHDELEIWGASRIGMNTYLIKQDKKNSIDDLLALKW